MNPFSLTGKNVLVTGASSGIGRAIAKVCANMGASLVITGRNPERLAETYSLLDGTNHTQHCADLTVEGELQSLVRSLPPLDGMVSNAGIIKTLVVQSVEKEDVEEIMQVNAIAPIHLSRLLVQNKKLTRGASLVFVSSINGNNCAYIGSSLYAASKSALTGFMKSIALELAPRYIRVNCINPGMIETGLMKQSVLGVKEHENDLARYPLKRYGKPEEVAYAAVYLLSDASEWITGSSLVIDGGYTII
jgi:NAD(P)-dependent dehydrogenase (short-subunit alcohol dehydrogenase family)